MEFYEACSQVHLPDPRILTQVSISRAVAMFHISGLAHKETAFWKARPTRKSGINSGRKSAYVDNNRDWKKELADMNV